MTWFIAQLVLLLVGAFLLGAVLGWVVRSWRRRPPVLDPRGDVVGTTTRRDDERVTALDERLRAVEERARVAEERAGELDVQLATAIELVADRDAQLSDRDEQLQRLQATVERLRSTSSDEVRLVRPAPTGADGDITDIRGIGPKTSSVLRDAGLGTLAALAGSQPDDLRDVLSESGVRWVKDDLVDTWPGQARELIGDEVGDPDGTGSDPDDRQPTRT